MIVQTNAFAAVLLAALAMSPQSTAVACSERKPTPQTGPGPHDFTTAPSESKLWQEGDGGEPLFLRARVLDTCGEPISGARVRVLHANEHGEHDPNRWRTHLDTDAGGTFEVITVLPGYTGGLARHIHFVITHPDHAELVTRLFFKNDPGSDAETEDLTMVLEEIRRGDRTAWVAGYEFVLPPG